MYLVSTTENKFFLFLLTIKALFLGGIIVFYQIHLAPDEAQYWAWSQAIDWGYYSKPPAIAWQIALTTALFGNNELGVRFGALVIGFLLPVIIFMTAKSTGLKDKTAFWAGILTAFSPLGFFFSFAATTDGGATFFFTLALCTFAKGLKDQKGPRYLLIGLWILCGALYKWVAFVGWILIFFFLFFYPQARKKNVWIGVLISLLALLPSLYWNIFHEWATFKHVGSTIVHKTILKGNFIDFLAAQIALLSPIYAAILFCSIISLFRRKNRSLSSLIVAGTTTSAVGIYLGMALFKKMQPNWALYLYPIGFLVAAWWTAEKHAKGKIWLTIGSWLSVLLTMGSLLIPLFQSKNFFSFPYKANPFRQNMGWDKIPTALEEVGYRPNEHFLLGDKYQSASLLSFYSAEQNRAYYFNLNNQRKNQFSYWPGMEEKEVGKSGFFIVLENADERDLPWFQTHYEDLLSPYFEHIHYAGAFPLFTANNQPVKWAIIFRVENYNGKSPINSEKY